MAQSKEKFKSKKKRFRCKQCYSRARIIIALNDQIKKQRTAIGVLSTELTQAKYWTDWYQKRVDAIWEENRNLRIANKCQQELLDAKAAELEKPRNAEQQ